MDEECTSNRYILVRIDGREPTTLLGMKNRVSTLKPQESFSWGYVEATATDQSQP